MNEIISKLEEINLLVGALEYHDKTKFSNEIAIDINNLNEIIYSIENKLFECKLSEEKCAAIELANRKEKIIIKQLFAPYWIIHEKINSMDSDQLTKLEKASEL